MGAIDVGIRAALGLLALAIAFSGVPTAVAVVLALVAGCFFWEAALQLSVVYRVMGINTKRMFGGHGEGHPA